MPLYPVTLSAGAAALIRHHARDDAPAECCGALLGHWSGGRVYLGVARAVPSQVPSPTRYAIGADACRRLDVEAAAAGLELLGFYHSHPAGDAVPSATDLALAWPGFTYVIVDAAGGLRAWRLADDRSRFDEVPLRTAGLEDAA
jgi:desampylase